MHQRLRQLDLDPPVLNYQSVPQRTPALRGIELVRWIVSLFMDVIGGPNWALFILSIVLVEIALIEPMTSPLTMIAAGCIWMFLIDRWSKSSRYF